GMVERELTITNSGGSDLLVNLSAELSSAGAGLVRLPRIDPAVTSLGRKVTAAPPRPPTSAYPPAPGTPAPGTIQASETGGTGRSQAGVIGTDSAPPSLEVVNGCFESVSFNGWSASSNGRGQLTPWSVARAGFGWFGTSGPLEGRYEALNGLDGQ